LWCGAAPVSVGASRSLRYNYLAVGSDQQASRVQLIVPDVPKRIVRALNREAKQRNVSVSEVAAGILAAHYGVPLEPTNSHYIPVTSEARLMPRVPVEVRQALREQAAANGATMSGLVRQALAAHYGFNPPAPTRRSRGKR
jgi:predicted HicB family RNase H-like nuclease